MSAGLTIPMDIQNAPGVNVGDQPGMLEIPGVGWVEAESWNQEIMYDSEILATPLAAGDQYTFFRSTTFQLTGARKNARYTNMVVPQQLPSGWKAYVYNMGFRVLQINAAGAETTPLDTKRTLEHGVGTMRTGDQKVEKQGPLTFWPCPYGISGIDSRTGPALTEFAYLNNGVPSPGAVPPMSITLNLSRELTFECSVQFPDGLTNDAQVVLQMIMWAYVAKPVR